MSLKEVRRVKSDLRLERRAEGEAPAIVGHAAVFDVWTTLYDGTYYTMREVVRPGAFRNALAEKQDVLASVNHDDDDLPLGRTGSGTLELAEDGLGLAVRITPPDTQLGRDVLVSIGRGDLAGMSFCFACRPEGDRTTITTDAAGKTIEERELLDVDLADVSVVTHPAYPQTDVAIRSRCESRDKPRRDPWRDRAWVRLRLAEAWR